VPISPHDGQAGAHPATRARRGRQPAAAQRELPAGAAGQRAQPRHDHRLAIGVAQLGRYLEREGLPTRADRIAKDHVLGFIASLVDVGAKPATVVARLRGLRAFWRWALAEGEVGADPSAGITPPRIPDEPLSMPSDDDVRRLLASCDGPSFLERRDRAFLLVLIDSGLRRAECLGLRLADVDLAGGLLQVRRGKGGSPRIVPIGARATAALDRYVRARERHRAEAREELWLARDGAHSLSPSAVDLMLRARSLRAGIDPITPHRLRHFSVHRFLAAGGTESSAQRIYGWRSPQMLMRYAAARGVERAIGEHRRLGIADRL